MKRSGEVFAIIPARGGSKAVPKKNIKLLGGYPLIAFSVAAAKLASGVERVIVSTDSPEIAEVAATFGAEVPFLRPSEFARDDSPDSEFFRHAIMWLEENGGGYPEYLVHLRPTTPLRDPRLVSEAIVHILERAEATSLRSVHEMAESPHKMFEIKDGLLAGFFPDDPRPEYYNLPRQAFPRAYNPNGYVDIVKAERVVTGESLHGPRMLGFITPMTGEVDRPEDFEYIEYSLSRRQYAVFEYLKREFPRAGPL